MSTAVMNGFDFMCIPLVHPRYRRDAKGISDSRETPLTRSDKVMGSDKWTTSIVGKISPWIDLDSRCPATRRSSEEALKEELRWGTHLALPAVWLKAPEGRSRCTNYARNVVNMMPANSHTRVWIEIPLVSPETMLRARLSSPASEAEEGKSDGVQARASSLEDDPWEAWNSFRTTCGHHANLAVALVVTENLPENASEAILRWQGEPVRALVLPTSIFLTNASGYPTLSQAHQAFLLAMMKYKAQIVVRGKSRNRHGLSAYVKYLHYLNNEKRPKPTTQDDFESPFYDTLQMPLQPLMDNLESQTYETFEKDPVKYRQYEFAVRDALLKTPVDKTTLIMVVGAGRGPLVQASIRASQSAKRRVKIFAVEKNPNAVITLRNLKEDEEWGDTVTIVASDMRVWKAPAKADILVSELLGSFGDNELSPECLDGAQSFLNPSTGISIPCDSTSFLAPIMSQKLWNEVEKFRERKYFETPYVVKMHNYAALGDVKPCFCFVHPNHSARIDNTRHATLKFQARFNALIHGFAGYFHSNLYGNHAISIEPSTESKGMFSWFPIYFPIRTPTYVRKGETIELDIWRCVSSKKVWYEWALASPARSPVHNPRGRSYWIGL